MSAPMILDVAGWLPSLTGAELAGGILVLAAPVALIAGTFTLLHLRGPSLESVRRIAAGSGLVLIASGLLAALFNLLSATKLAVEIAAWGFVAVGLVAVVGASRPGTPPRPPLPPEPPVPPTLN